MGMHNKAVRWLGTGVWGAALVALLGCTDEESNRLFVVGPDSALTEMALMIPAIQAPPSGTSRANKLQLIDFDVELRDAFARAAPGIGLFAADPFFGERGWNLWSTGRNRTSDPRLPALGGLGTERIRRFCALWPPNFGGIGPGFWDLFCEMEGMKPLTRFTIMLVRYGTRVNGQLDAVEKLLTGTVTEPDELILLGGRPRGYPDVPCDFTTGVPVLPDANPFVLGFADSRSNGRIQFFDCVPVSAGFWWANDGSAQPPPGAADSVAFAPNRLATFNLPTYNYVVLVEGEGTVANPVPPGPHVFRWQVGVDLDENGLPINNAFAPFPTAKLSEAALAGGKGAKNQPDSVRLTLTNLKELTGGAVYQLWFFGGGTTPEPATGRYLHIGPDGTTLLDVAASSFVGGLGQHIAHLDYPAIDVGRTHVLVSIEAGPGASAPSASQPLWLRALQDFGETKSLTQALSFGTFAGGDALRVWSISGQGLGNLFGPEMRINFAHLPRPPVGYQYVGWIVGDPAKGDETLVRLPNESFTSPPREYAELTNADVEAVSAVVQALEILEATQRFCWESVSGCPGPFSLAAPAKRYLLTLEPKAGQAEQKGPTDVLAGSLPVRE